MNFMHCFHYRTTQSIAEINIKKVIDTLGIYVWPMSWSQLTYGRILQHLTNVGQMLFYPLTSALKKKCVRWTLAQHLPRCEPIANGSTNYLTLA